jgi:drug/metabolite transporter (DMT)-like permease
MIYLIGSIILSSYLTLAFKGCEKYSVNVFQAIVINYITCVITGSVVNGSFPITTSSFQFTWFQWACGMGILFISLFNIIGITAQKNGVAVASVANKLSLIIPVVLSIYLYNEPLSIIKWVGVLMALAAVIFTCYTPSSNTQSASSNYLLPVLLFIGSGVLDAIINHVQKNYVTTDNSNAYLITGFLSAATIGVIILLFQLINGKQKLATKNIVAGILIGIPNYFSIWCLMKFLKQSPWQSNASIPVNNMGIVLFSTVAAWLLFKEKLSAINWIGVILSLIAIALIAFG